MQYGQTFTSLAFPPLKSSMTNGLLKTLLQEEQETTMLRPFVSSRVTTLFLQVSLRFGACLSSVSFFRKPEARATTVKAMEANSEA